MVYDPPRFMTVPQAVDQLLQIINSKLDDTDEKLKGVYKAYDYKI